MKAEIRDRWVEALRSGKYRQTKGVLHRYRGGYCCLGVLCELAVKDGALGKPEKDQEYWEYDGEDSMPPGSVYEWAGIDTQEEQDFMASLADANDKGMKFAKIADKIEGRL